MGTWVLVIVIVAPLAVVGHYLGLRKPHWTFSFPASVAGAIHGSLIATVGNQDIWPDAVLWAVIVYFAFSGFWALGSHLRLYRLAQATGEQPISEMNLVILNVVAVVILGVCLAIFT